MRTHIELARQRQELARARDAAEAANRELEAFSYSVAHDLRTPLRSIDGFSYVLLEEHAARLDASGQALLDEVRRAAQHMAQLIDVLLNLARVTRSELHRRPVDLAALARSAFERLQRAEPQRVVELVVAPLPLVEGDSALVTVVLDNLVGNAWKFTHKKATARIEIGTQVTAGQRVFYVRDNGAGFDMAYAARLFTAFSRLHTTTEFEGTGVGLATVDRIIRRHGGRVWAEGVVEGGATFYFTLAGTSR